jgi:hypothetical protein
LSKKTIAFTLPATATRGRKADPIPAPVEAPSGDGALISGAARPPSDDWVRERDLAAYSGPAPNPPATTRLALDLTAEPTLGEVMSLSVLVPFALGWFWFADAMSGRTRI